MRETSLRRLRILQVLLISMFVALAGRLYTMQIVNGEEYANRAADIRSREIVDPATRGIILDQMGRPLVNNRSTIVVSVSAISLLQQEDEGAAVLAKLAPLLKMTTAELTDRITVCGTEGAKRPPICWNGSIYQPIPVARDVNLDVAVRIMERRIEFPGVTAEVQAVRNIPGTLNANLAHVLGYLGPVNDTELADRNGTDNELQSTDLIGRAGLEAYYDKELRGTPGVTTLSIDRNLAIIGEESKTEPVAGSYLVLSIDAALQRVVELQLQAAIQRAREQGFAGDSGAAVVMDVRTGQVLAMASSPTYDPAIWLNGVTEKEYADLVDEDSNSPLLSRATQGLFAPASTFKVVTTAAAAAAGVPMGQTLYPCPSSITLGNRTMENHESSAYGNITVARALEVSCNTVFYQIGYNLWLKDGGNEPVANPRDAIEQMAKRFGLGSRTGIDLPSESRGRVGGRAFKTSQYQRFKDLWCYRAKIGYPEVAKTDPARADYLKRLAGENCVDGGVLRGGDAANLSIGQGDTVATPLQMATLYAALANGGKLLEPRLVKAIVSADGKTVTETKPTVKRQINIDPATLQYIKKALEGVVTDGTGRSPFAGWPQSLVRVAAKTGSGEAGIGKDPTSWFASFAPAGNPKYAVVVMVSQGGTGSLTSGPSVRRIYEALFGVTGSQVNPKDSVLYKGKLAITLPRVSVDGVVRQVPGADTAATTAKRRFGIGD